MPAPPPGRRAAYLRSLVAHYYGNEVRMLFISCTVLIVILTPTLGDILPGGIRFVPFSSVVLLGLAALTNPKSKMVIIMDYIVAGIFVVLVEIVALWFYSADSFLTFAAREVVGIMFMLAMYFSLKTSRAMELNQIGRKDLRADEFDIE